MNQTFPFNKDDHLECFDGNELVVHGNAYAAHAVSEPHQTLFQWVLVDVSPGRREWIPHGLFKKL